MAQGEEFKTVFQTYNGYYEYRVMPYAVTRGPATFQEIINEILAPFLRKFEVVLLMMCLYTVQLGKNISPTSLSSSKLYSRINYMSSSLNVPLPSSSYSIWDM